MTELMKRPTMKDDFVVKRCLELCMPRIKQWLDDPREDEATTREQLGKVLGPHRDGYEMARDLESMGWASNSRLVEVLEECTDDCRIAIDELTAQWVRCYQITPEFAIGDTVMIRHKRELAQVVKIYAEEAKYGVRVPGQTPNSWFVEAYENVSRPVVQPPQQSIGSEVVA